MAKAMTYQPCFYGWFYVRAESENRGCDFQAVVIPIGHTKLRGRATIRFSVDRWAKRRRRRHLKGSEEMAAFGERTPLISRVDATDRTEDAIQDKKSDGIHEISKSDAGEEPDGFIYKDPAYNNPAARNRRAGLSIWFFVGLAIFLIAVSAGVLIYAHAHH